MHRALCGSECCGYLVTPAVPAGRRSRESAADGGACLRACAQFVYDAWFGSMSPDREFPAEIRRALNCAFGELAVRSRRVDPRAILKCALPAPHHFANGLCDPDPIHAGVEPAENL